MLRLIKGEGGGGWAFRHTRSLREAANGAAKSSDSLRNLYSKLVHVREKADSVEKKMIYAFFGIEASVKRVIFDFGDRIPILFPA